MEVHCMDLGKVVDYGNLRYVNFSCQMKWDLRVACLIHACLSVAVATRLFSLVFTWMIWLWLAIPIAHSMNSKQNSAHFNAKHEGKLHWFLGMGIDQDASFNTSLNQTKYIEDLVAKFIPDTSTLVIKRPTPAPADKFHTVGLATTDEERARMSTRPYLQLIGSLLYLSTMSRPDISYYMSVLCRVMSDPSEEAYEQALGILRYLYHTRHHKISYRSDFTVPESLWKYRNTINNY